MGLKNIESCKRKTNKGQCKISVGPLTMGRSIKGQGTSSNRILGDQTTYFCVNNDVAREECGEGSINTDVGLFLKWPLLTIFSITVKQGTSK